MRTSIAKWLSQFSFLGALATALLLPAWLPRATCAESPPSDDGSSVELWALVLDRWRAEHLSVSAIEFRFDYRSERTTPRESGLVEGLIGPTILDKKVSYQRSGTAFREEVEMRQDNESIVNKVTTTCDGSIVRRRDGGILLVGKSVKKRNVPHPLKTLCLVQPEKLAASVEAGTLSLKSSKREAIDDNDCVRIELAADDGSRFIAWYDTTRGSLPLRTRNVDPRGKIVHEARITSIAAVHRNGSGVVHFPLRGTRTSGSGSSREVVHIAVDPESIRIDHEIPVDRFVLSPLPNETVFEL